MSGSDSHAVDGKGDLSASGAGETGEYPPTPWHFKVLLIAFVLYLAYRGVQGVVWLIHHF